MLRILPFLALLFVTPLSAQDASLNKGLATALQPFVDRNTLAGAVVLVADREKILALEAVGFSDVEAKTPMKTNALFWIASQSKPLTAAGLMILVDEGKVKLDDPAEKYLPEFADIKFESAKPKTPITVRMLLSHMSGMPFASAAEKPTLDGLSLQDGVASYVKTPLQAEPGTKHIYSNAGINAAGRIIEVVSGMPYETFMDKRLLEPLGMKDTTFWPDESQVKRLSKGYKPNAAKDGLAPTQITQLKYPLTDRTRKPMPAGGYFSTAADCARFCQMLLNDGKWDGKQLLSKEAVKEMTKRQTPETVPQVYGLGLSVNGPAFGHGGAMSTDMSVDAKKGIVTVFLVQHAGFPGDGGKAKEAFRSAVGEKFPAK